MSADDRGARSKRDPTVADGVYRGMSEDVTSRHLAPGRVTLQLSCDESQAFVLTTDQLNTALAGRYAIERRVGEGGMATVYLARDLRHNRKVALKVLKPDLGVVVGVDRFLSEIEVTANLQHPNLLPLFDSGTAAGLLYYVMPFVEGESLRARLEREKLLPVEEAVRIAAAVAGALDYAHAHGVIHRDLKPENILLQHGQPVVADFGIALAVSNAGGNRITQTGISLGTPQYMSPEQATGDRAIDARTDVYSLGAITYEMLTGDPPHTGSSSQTVIARLLTEKPRPVRATRPNVPMHVEAAVDRALEKLPADRFASALEFAESLTGARRAMLDARTVVPPTRGPDGWRHRGRFVPWALAVASMGVAVWALVRSPSAGSVPLRLQVEIPDSVVVRSPVGAALALSRDGTELAFVGWSDSVFARRARPGTDRRMLYLRRLADAAALPVPGTEGVWDPSFSPDGRMLLFVAGTPARGGPGLTLRTVPVSGGTPTEIARDVGNSASWGDDGQILFTSPRGLEAVSSGGGDRRIVTPTTPKRFLVWVETLPGGRYALVTYATSGLVSASLTRLAVVSVADGSMTDLGVQGSNAHYAAGYIVFVRGGGEAFAAPFSLARRKVTAAPVPLVRDLAAGSSGVASPAVSENGTLAYIASTASIGLSDLVIVDRHGAVNRLTREPAAYSHPRVSPDGRRLTVTIGASIVNDVGGAVYVYDVATGAGTLVSTDSNSARSEWTRDGSKILYRQQLSDSSLLLSRPWNLSSLPTVVARGSGQSFFEVAPGPPGGFTAMRRGTAGPNGNVPTTILVAPNDSLGAARPVFDRVASIAAIRVSPDGKFLAYTSNESHRPEVYVMPIPGPGPRVQASANGGTEPAWSRDGHVLYYRSPQTNGGEAVIAAAIAGRPDFSVTRRETLFADVFARAPVQGDYDLFPDGRFLMLRPQSPSTPQRDRLYVMVNWPRWIQPRGARTEP